METNYTEQAGQKINEVGQKIGQKFNELTQDYSPNREGPIARAIEKQTAKLPSDFWLWAAGASIIGSLVFQGIGMFGGPRSQARQLINPVKTPVSAFLGMWAPTFLLLGVYNKLVKIAGSDRYDPVL